MRLFVALGIPEDARSRLAAVQAGLPPIAKKTGKDGMHITLFFLGKVEGGKIWSISQALSAAANASQPFECTVANTGAFPSQRLPSVVWAGVSGEGLDALASEVAASLRELGFSQDMPFSGHVTLARVREIGEFSEFFQKHSSETYGKFTVEKMHLMQSRPGPAGPEYSTLKTFSLGGDSL